MYRRWCYGITWASPPDIWGNGGPDVGQTLLSVGGSLYARVHFRVDGILDLDAKAATSGSRINGISALVHAVDGVGVGWVEEMVGIDVCAI